MLIPKGGKAYECHFRCKVVNKCLNVRTKSVPSLSLPSCETLMPVKRNLDCKKNRRKRRSCINSNSNFSRGSTEQVFTSIN